MIDTICQQGVIPFTQVTNEVIRDKDLGAIALAIYTYIRSHDQSKYTVYKKNVEKRFKGDDCKNPIGRTLFDKGWAELIDKGWLISERTKNDEGKFTQWNHTLMVNKPIVTDLQDTDTRNTDSPNTESQNPAVLKNTNIKNTKNKNTKNKKLVFDCPNFLDQEDWNHYLNVIRVKIKAPNTERSVKLLVNKITKIEQEKKGSGQEALENAIESGWKSFYPVKQSNGSKAAQIDSRAFISDMVDKYQNIGFMQPAAIQSESEWFIEGEAVNG